MSKEHALKNDLDHHYLYDEYHLLRYRTPPGTYLQPMPEPRHQRGDARYLHQELTLQLQL